MKLSVPILLTVLLFGCQIRQKDDVHIELIDKSLKGKVVSVRTANPLNLEADTLAKGRVDSTGMLKLNFQINRNRFAELFYGTKVLPIYLERGYEIKLRIKDGNIVSISGTGSAPNNYVQKVSRIKSEIEMLDGKNSYELGEADYLARLRLQGDSLTKLNKLFSDSSINQPTMDLLQKRNKVILLLMKQAFGWNHADNFRVPSAFDVSAEIPQDSLLLSSTVFEYALLLQMNLNLNYVFSAFRDKSPREVEYLRAHAPVIIEEKIKEDSLPPFLKEFMLAKNVDYMLSFNGKTTSLDSAYNHFRKQYPNSVWNRDLAGRYKKYLALEPGNPAPIIKGVTVGGDAFLSSELRGRVAYVDIWATWCGPCVAEIPESIKLQREFQGRNDVVFLNVSVDNNEKNWKEKLVKESTWKGIHIVNDRSIYKSYLLSGIPHYVLIDKAGNIANVNAPRPSSGKAKAAIESLLR